MEDKLYIPDLLNVRRGPQSSSHVSYQRNPRAHQTQKAGRCTAHSNVRWQWVNTPRPPQPSSCKHQFSFLVAATGSYESSVSSDYNFNAICCVSGSLNEKILLKDLGLDLHMLQLCHYTTVQNTMHALQRGFRLTVCWWHALRSSDRRCYLNRSNSMLKCLEFPVDICTRALLPSQTKNIWNP